MNIQIPYFSGSTEERVRQIEGWIRELAERQAAFPFDIISLERGARQNNGDEIVVTYSDGTKRRYLLTLVQG